MGEIRVRSISTSEAGIASPLVLEQAFGKYTLIAKIGHGGMAEVFLAAAKGPAGFTKLSVVKRLHPHLEEEEVLVGMFLDEARLAARLNHPNVVQTFDVGDVDGLHYLAMEYLEGQSLARLLKRVARSGQTIPLGMACRIFTEALHGLEYAHTLEDYDGTPLGVVHRDISPGNLFLTYEGQVKVLDFGIAKAGTQLTETRAGQVKGKFAYIAPEQARSGQHDHRADLWSLGVVMWEVIAGKRLFKGDSEISTLNNALRSDIVQLDQAVDVPPELSAIVGRALQRDPEQRYRSARELREDIVAFMQREGLHSTRSELGSFLAGFFDKDRDEQRAILKAHMAGELQGQVMTPVPSAGSGSHSGVITNPPTHHGQGPGRWAVALVFLLAALVGAMAAWLLRKDGTEVAETDGVRTEPLEPLANQAPESAGGDRESESAVGDRESAVGDRESEVGDRESAVGDRESEVGDRESVSAVGESESESGSETEAGPTVTMAADTESTRRRRRARRRTTPMETEMVEPAMEAAPAEEAGFLTLDTIPWSEVRLGSRNLGTTPLRRIELPPGSHTLTLVNPERGLRTRYQVTIRPGQTVTRRVGLE
ncbi:MAG: serine/threonine protein kinase [Deltaproteobacteria bacterium]|nr:serine/threonine protein kinase [Deltaproteobacteria bacterium]